MKLFKKKTASKGKTQRPTRAEALAGIPRISPEVAWKIVEDGTILIEYPLHIKPFFLQLAKRFTRSTRLINKQDARLTKKLQLDGMGSKVWQLFDGKKNIKTIIKEVTEFSGLTLQEAEISVTTFLRDLGRRGLIVIH